jgi:hypothetical protein
MTTSRAATAQQPPKDPDPCDSTTITELSCGPTRTEGEAAVVVETKERLDGHITANADARTTYTAAWKKAEADRTAAHATLETLLKELRCRLDDAAESCLNTVWGALQAELDECTSGTEGCRVAPCDPDESVAPDTSQGALAGRIEDLRDQAERHEKYFTDLLKEITELPERAEEAKTEVTQLEADARSSTAGPGATPAPGSPNDVVTLYARALVARWNLEHVRGGFDSIDDFLNCLCRALAAVLRTWKAIRILEGEKAYRACVEAGSGGSCDVLLADPLSALLDRFRRECSPTSGGNGPYPSTAS